MTQYVKGNETYFNPNNITMLHPFLVFIFSHVCNKFSDMKTRYRINIENIKMGAE